jgi:hypothetical protein
LLHHGTDEGGASEEREQPGGPEAIARPGTVAVFDHLWIPVGVLKLRKKVVWNPVQKEIGPDPLDRHKVFDVVVVTESSDALLAKGSGMTIDLM